MASAEQAINAKGRTDITRVAAYFDRPINEAARLLGALCERQATKACVDLRV